MVCWSPKPDEHDGGIGELGCARRGVGGPNRSQLGQSNPIAVQVELDFLKCRTDKNTWQ